MKLENQITLGLVLIFVVVQIFAHRYDIRHWFRNLWWGEEKHTHIRVVRYDQGRMGDWQKNLRKSINFLVRQDYKFNQKEKDNLALQLRNITDPWAEEVKKDLKLPFVMSER